MDGVVALHAGVVCAAIALAAWIAQRELGGALARNVAVQGLAAAGPLAAVILFGQSVSIGCHIGALSSVSLAIARIDHRRFLIPDVLVAAVIALALAAPHRLSALDMASGAAVLGAMFLSVRLIHARVRHTEGLGLGDVKLAMAMGALLGLEVGLLAVVLATIVTMLWIAAPAIRTNGPQVTLRTQAPFGVGLAAALAACGAAAAILP